MKYQKYFRTGKGRNMPADMKIIISEAAKRLLFEKNLKKLTVKDIVAECGITRQAFYYHFEDIPAMIQWTMEKNMNQALAEAFAQGDSEKGLLHCFLIAINAAPYVKKGMQTNYGEELERSLTQYVYRFFEQVIETEHLYQNCSRFELNLIIRYHSQAILGILRSWTEEDSKNLERIVHEVYLLMSGEISPYS